MDAIPTVLVIARSIVWKSSIQISLRHHFPTAKISWGLDIDDIFHEPAQVSIVQLTPKTVASDCLKISTWATQTTDSVCFAVGDMELKPWLPLLRTCGLVDNCLSLSGIPRLMKQVGDCFNRQLTPLTVETWVLASLPWHPAT